MGDNSGEIRIFDAANKATVFIIDYGQYMHENEKHRFLMAIKALRHTLNELCCTGNDKELVSVLFANTSKSNASADWIDNIFVHRELSPLDVEYIKELDEYLNDSNGARSKLHEKLGEPNVCNWMEVFFHCKKAFIDSYRKRVISKQFVQIFSSQHVDPVDSDTLNTAITHAGDLRRTKTSINVFLLCDHEEFHDQVNPFWLNFDDDATFVYEVDGFCSDIKRKTYALRSNTSLPFRLADGVEIAVGVYYLIKPKTAPQYIYLHPETNQRVECKTHFIRPSQRSDENDVDAIMDEEGGSAESEVIFSKDMKYAIELGGEQVVISQQEKEALNRIDKPGIILIGFKPLSLLKPSYRMGQSTYMYPLDSAIKGSVNLYHALLIKCLQREVFMLARYTQKVNTSPKLVAIVPQAGTHSNKTLEPYMFEGFHILRLPFAEDSRSMEQKFKPPEGLDAWPSANKEQVKAAGDFIKRLTTQNFRPDDFANPINQRLYKVVETVALNLSGEDLERQLDELDQIRPYYKNPKYKQRAAAELDRFMSACGATKDDVDASTSESANKGKRGRKSAKNASKNKQIDDMEE